jgi:hypothetical protein
MLLFDTLECRLILCQEKYYESHSLIQIVLIHRRATGGTIDLKPERRQYLILKRKVHIVPKLIGYFLGDRINP